MPLSWRCVAGCRRHRVVHSSQRLSGRLGAEGLGALAGMISAARVYCRVWLRSLTLRCSLGCVRDGLWAPAPAQDFPAASPACRIAVVLQGTGQRPPVAPPAWRRGGSRLAARTRSRRTGHSHTTPPPPQAPHRTGIPLRPLLNIFRNEASPPPLVPHRATPRRVTPSPRCLATRREWSE